MGGELDRARMRNLARALSQIWRAKEGLELSGGRRQGPSGGGQAHLLGVAQVPSRWTGTKISAQIVLGEQVPLYLTDPGRPFRRASGFLVRFWTTKPPLFNLKVTMEDRSVGLFCSCHLAARLCFPCSRCPPVLVSDRCLHNPRVMSSPGIDTVDLVASWISMSRLWSCSARSRAHALPTVGQSSQWFARQPGIAMCPDMDDPSGFNACPTWTSMRRDNVCQMQAST